MSECFLQRIWWVSPTHITRPCDNRRTSEWIHTIDCLLTYLRMNCWLIGLQEMTSLLLILQGEFFLCMISYSLPQTWLKYFSLSTSHQTSLSRIQMLNLQIKSIYLTYAFQCNQAQKLQKHLWHMLHFCWLSDTLEGHCVKYLENKTAVEYTHTYSICLTAKLLTEHSYIYMWNKATRLATGNVWSVSQVLTSQLLLWSCMSYS